LASCVPFFCGSLVPRAKIVSPFFPSLEPVKKKQIGLCSRSPQNIMGSEPSKNADLTLHLEGKTVSLRDSALPNVSRILHFFDIQGRVTPVTQEKL